jgi:hypothetical protein
LKSHYSFRVPCFFMTLRTMSGRHVMPCLDSVHSGCFAHAFVTNHALKHKLLASW